MDIYIYIYTFISCWYFCFLFLYRGDIHWQCILFSYYKLFFLFLFVFYLKASQARVSMSQGQFKLLYLRNSFQHFTRILEGKKTKLIDIKSQLDNWQKLNTSVNNKIQEIKLATCKLTIRCNEDARVKDFKHQRVKLKAIMKKNRLITRVQNNYDDLLTLRSQLEILRLKTYPTLRLRKKWLRLFIVMLVFIIYKENVTLLCNFECNVIVKKFNSSK